MKCPTPLRIFVLAGLAAGLVLPAADAAVAVRVGPDGSYRAVHMVPSADADGRLVDIWSVGQRGRVASRRFQPLNPDGDALGDHWPAVAESGDVDGYPWAVWSRDLRGAAGREIVWSAWTGREWSAIQPIGAPTAGDDLDPSILFVGARPYVSWWRDEGGIGAVYLSTFQNGAWTEPYRVTPEGLDAREPTLYTHGDRYIEVRFLLDGGMLSQFVVTFFDPGTITDDINPMAHSDGFLLKGRPVRAGVLPDDDEGDDVGDGTFGEADPVEAPPRRGKSGRGR